MKWKIKKRWKILNIFFDKNIKALRIQKTFQLSTDYTVLKDILFDTCLYQQIEIDNLSKDKKNILDINYNRIQYKAFTYKDNQLHVSFLLDNI